MSSGASHALCFESRPVSSFSFFATRRSWRESVGFRLWGSGCGGGSGRERHCAHYCDAVCPGGPSLQVKRVQ